MGSVSMEVQPLEDRLEFLIALVLNRLELGVNPVLVVSIFYLFNDFRQLEVVAWVLLQIMLKSPSLPKRT